MIDHPSANRLAHETSPYLQQHALNPVDWYPWGPEALERAQREQKPILLSIGYSACHWCHVMAHESFEDSATAQVMNELFINIKVDREERPDIDKIYQTAYQLLNRRAGGWPLTMFLTHDDQVPFFGATYVPKDPRYGMPAFSDLLRRIHGFYQANEGEVRQQNTSLLEVLTQLEGRGAQAKLDATPLTRSRDQLLQNLDPVHGGFGSAPKFPHPTNIEALLRRWANSVSQGEIDRPAANAALFTLEKMAQGGIYDHLGGGFCRYSTDEHWLIPHFEKMLYDNGPLIGLYSQAWAATGKPLFRQTAEGIGDWVLRQMQSPAGGYYATLDADSEGEEGKFYVWLAGEVQQLLAPEDYVVAEAHFGLDQPPNFEGRWHLHQARPLAEVADSLAISLEEAETRLERSRKTLFEIREHRIPPNRDEKILGSWNGLMIRGMAIAGRLLGREDFLDSAQRAVDFIRDTLWQDDRLLATFKDGRAHLNAYLDDYALLAEGLIALLEARWRDEDLRFAVALTDALLQHFQDSGGGFFFTADDHEPLIQRPKPFFDDALPAGNGVAAGVLLRLGHLLGREDYLTAAERTLRWGATAMQQNPLACGALVLALEDYLEPAQQIIVRGATATLPPWQQRLAEGYAPRRLGFTIPEGAELPDFLANKTAGMAVKAYCCSGLQCEPPIEDLAILDHRLQVSEVKPG